MNMQPRRLNNRQFEKYCSLVYRECGIKLNNEKRSLLNARISKRLRLLEVSPDQYYERIIDDPREMAHFIDAVSTNHTYFFRESSSFKYLGPEMTEIWCAACSSGEEPYSLAAYCLQLGNTPSILATDISNTCLQKAQTGIYDDQCLNNIPVDIKKAFFQKGINGWTGMVRVKKSLKQVVAFKKFNLLKSNLPDRYFDAIFCRNVMIYFDGPTKERIVNRLNTVLRSGGYFVIGGAESLNGLNHPFAYVEPSVYRKP